MYTLDLLFMVLDAAVDKTAAFMDSTVIMTTPFATANAQA